MWRINSSGSILGTTSFKGAVLDLEHRRFAAILPVSVIGSSSRSFPLATNWTPRSPSDVFGVCSAIYFRVCPGGVGLLICNQMHSVVLTDEDGAAQSNVMTWKDQRATELSSRKNWKRIRRSLSSRHGRKNVSRLGGELRFGVPIVTLAALRESAELAAWSTLRISGRLRRIQSEW